MIAVVVNVAACLLLCFHICAIYQQKSANISIIIFQFIPSPSTPLMVFLYSNWLIGSSDSSASNGEEDGMSIAAATAASLLKHLTECKQQTDHMKTCLCPNMSAPIVKLYFFCAASLHKQCSCC